MITTPPLGLPVSPNHRLLAGLALSILAHGVLISAIRPRAVAYPSATPLWVHIERIAPEPAPVAVPQASESPHAALPTPAAPAAAPVAPRPPGAAPEPIAGLNLGPVSDRYYTSREVDVRAEPLNDVDLVYPQRAYQNRTRGKVVLRILISERGFVDEVSVVEAQPAGLFEEAALTAARALSFRPAQRFGRNVRSQVTIQVDFDPYESIHIP